jgi:hypothetical protein
MHDIARYRDIINQVLNEGFENDELPDVSHKEVSQIRKNRRREENIIKDWLKKEQTKNKKYAGLTYASFPWTIQRSFPDEEGEYNEIDITVYVSGEYEPGYKGSRWEPREDAGFHGIHIEWAEIDSNDPNTTPLTMSEKIKLTNEFDNGNSKLHNAAEQALFDQM